MHSDEALSPPPSLPHRSATWIFVFFFCPQFVLFPSGGLLRRLFFASSFNPPNYHLLGHGAFICTARFLVVLPRLVYGCTPRQGDQFPKTLCTGTKWYGTKTIDKRDERASTFHRHLKPPVPPPVDYVRFAPSSAIRFSFIFASVSFPDHNGTQKPRGTLFISKVVSICVCMCVFVCWDFFVTFSAARSSRSTQQGAVWPS